MNHILKRREDMKEILVGTEEIDVIKKYQGYIQALQDILDINFTEESV